MSELPFPKCPRCGRKVIVKEVEEIVRGGPHTAIIRVEAHVCHRCGERLYDVATVRRFEQIRLMLERDETAGFKAIGQSFQVA